METTFQIVKINSKGIVTVLANVTDRDTADVWVMGYVAGGGVSRKGKAESASTVEVWEVVNR